MHSYSTRPPPTVPAIRPPGKTAIIAPGPRGVEPWLSVTVHSTALTPQRTLCASAVNSSFMNDPPSFLLPTVRPG